MKTISIFTLFFVLLLMHSTSPMAQDADRGSTLQGYVPGLGEIMSAIQMRHAKLWFAGTGGNWQLAA